MWVLIVLLIVFAAFGVLGFVIKGLLWLAVIGIVLFLATAVFAGIKNRKQVHWSCRRPRVTPRWK